MLFSLKMKSLFTSIFGLLPKFFGSNLGFALEIASSARKRLLAMMGRGNTSLRGGSNATDAAIYTFMLVMAHNVPPFP